MKNLFAFASTGGLNIVVDEKKVRYWNTCLLQRYTKVSRHF